MPEATFGLNYVTMQHLKHSILWETLPLEVRSILATLPPSDTRATVFAQYGLTDEFFRRAVEAVYARSVHAPQPHIALC